MTRAVGFVSLGRLKRACCRIESDAAVGTGYLVGEKLIATCAHVVKDLPHGTRVKVRFGDDSRGLPLSASVAKVDAAADAAILELSEPVPNAAPLRSSAEPLSRTDWTAYGFPAFAEPMGIALAGLVMDSDAEIPGRIRGLALFSQMLGANPPSSVGGFSGSPVLVGDVVVGHLSSVLGAGNVMQQPHLGYAYAAPIAGVRALLGMPAAAATPVRTPTPPAEIVELSARFSGLQFAASAKDVFDALKSAARQNTLTPELRLYAAEVLISFGLPVDAMRVLEGLASQRADELRALSLSLQGRHAEALEHTSAMKASAEAQGIIGGTLKRRWLATTNATHLRSAFTTYYEAYTAQGNHHYPGVNAAACALYLGNRPASRDIAAQIVRQLADKKRDKWEQASYAESLLLAGEVGAASDAYRSAAELLGSGTRDLAVMRTQARRNLKYLSLDPAALAGAFPEERRVAAFTGHRVGKNLPSESISFVRGRLQDILSEQEVQFGYCSAASGADLLFIEAMLARDAEVHVYLPFPASHFRLTSVGPDLAWLSRFDSIMAQLVGRVTVISEEAPAVDDPMPYVRCNDAIQEAARSQARLLYGTPLLVAVVAANAEQDNPASGGTADAVRAWRYRGEKDIERIDPLPEIAAKTADVGARHAATRAAGGLSPAATVVPPAPAVLSPPSSSPARLVFISYKHDAPWSNMAKVLDQKLRNVSEALGYKVFLDRRMESGAVWSQDIDVALEATTHFIALLCDPYWASDECRRELHWMIRRWEAASGTGAGAPHLLFVRAGEMDPKYFTLGPARSQGALSTTNPLICQLSDINFLGPYDLSDVGKLDVLDWENTRRLDQQLGQLRDRFKDLMLGEPRG